MERSKKQAALGFIPGGKFFAGANTAKGFCTFYPELFRDTELCALFRIEGGPGTGKSTLMKKAADAAEKLGAGVERYFCSSDPDSLDAVRILPVGAAKMIALCDCTEPHPRAESTPGAVTRTVDLGRFRNDRRLARHREEILELQEKKGRAYQTAYRYLAAAGHVRQARLAILSESCDFEAMRHAARRSLLGNTGESGRELRRPLTALSMKGPAFLPADHCSYPRCFSAEDVYGTAELYLSVLAEEAKNSGLSVLGAPDCVSPEGYTALSIPEAELTVIASGAAGEHRAVRCGRFLDREGLAHDRRALRAAEKEEAALLGLTTDALNGAASCHFRLEELYSAAMDFTKKEKEDAAILALINELIRG